MKPPPFTYHAPSTVAECVEILARHGDEAKVLAGGQSLVPLMNLRMAAPSVVVDLNRIGGLAYIREDGPAIAIGAMTRHHDVATSEAVGRLVPLLAEAASLVGYPAIRHRGTIGGSLAHADAVAELPCAALALGAEVEVQGPRGARAIAVGELFAGHFTTVLEPDEVITEVRFPAVAEGDGWSFVEFSRKSGDFAIVAIAVHLSVAGTAVGRAAIAVSGVADRPLRAPGAEAALQGVPLAAVRPQEVAASIVADVCGAAGEYERELAAVLAERAVAQSLSRAGRAS